MWITGTHKEQQIFPHWSTAFKISRDYFRSETNNDVSHLLFPVLELLFLNIGQRQWAARRKSDVNVACDSVLWGRRMSVRKAIHPISFIIHIIFRILLVDSYPDQGNNALFNNWTFYFNAINKIDLILIAGVIFVVYIISLLTGAERTMDTSWF